jgi:hypothetical protein
MQTQDIPSRKPTPIPHPQDQLNSCKVSAICSRPVVFPAAPNTPQDTPQNLHSEEPYTIPQKHHNKTPPPAPPKCQMNSCKLSASGPSVVPEILPSTHQTSPKSPPPPEELDFKDVQYKSTDVRLRQPKEPSKGAHQPLVNKSVKTKVTIIVFTFYICNSFGLYSDSWPVLF